MDFEKNRLLAKKMHKIVFLTHEKRTKTSII
jgi:hypothetical protein